MTSGESWGGVNKQVKGKGVSSHWCLVSRATRKLEWTSLRAMGRATRGGISRKRRVIMGDWGVDGTVRKSRPLEPHLAVVEVFRAHVLGPQAERVRALGQLCSHRSGSRSRPKGSRLVWAAPETCQAVDTRDEEFIVNSSKCVETDGSHGSADH